MKRLSPILIVDDSFMLIGYFGEGWGHLHSGSRIDEIENGSTGGGVDSVQPHRVTACG